jgi:hypothetical protein
MQEGKRECEKKGKKQKYLKYFYVFCVKFWNGECDWWVDGLNNKIK